MATSWRRIALPAAVLGILVPVGFGAQALLSSSDDSGSAAAADSGPSASAPAFAGADTADAGAAVTEPSARSAPRTHSVAVRLASYDPRGRRAVLKTSKSQSVRAGDVIASAPSRLAPSGALFKVAKVTHAAEGHVTVTTAPATVAELLGDRTADARAALTAAELRVKPLADGVKTLRTPAAVTPSAHPTPQFRSSPAAPGSPAPTIPAGHASLTPGLPRDAASRITTLRLGVNVPLPAGVEATPTAPARLAGEIEFSPELIFAYEKRGGLNVLPQRAAVGLGGSYAYDWHVHGKVTRMADTGEVTKPLASVTGQHTFWIGPVPVVVNAEVLFFYRFTADGRITLDTEQHTTGSFDVGARYDREHGWQGVREARQQTSGGTPRIEGAATATARVGTRATVFLYDTAGVTGELSVYLKGRAAAVAGQRPAWELDAGYDLGTRLELQLRIFGISLVDLKTAPFTLHDQRRLLGQGTLPAA